jgi:phosphatidylinositol-3-phosphatase
VKRTTVIYLVVALAVIVAASLAYVVAPRHRDSSAPQPSFSRSATAAGVTATGTPAAVRPRPQRLVHIFLIVDENRSYSQIVGNPAAPYLNGLIRRSALATDYFALFHPSLPNYIALTSGSNQGITDDRVAAGNAVAATNIADRIEASGRSWKEYAESLPSSAYGLNSGLYATKHNPFVYYSDIVGDPRRERAHVVPFTQLAVDLRSAATTPDFAFITPNLVNDMHDSPTATGDRWLATTVPLILRSAAFKTTNSVLIVTWDEGTVDQHVATILAGNSVKTGYRSARRYDHYSLLHTIEAAWNLAPLTANDSHATIMSEFFK